MYFQAGLIRAESIRVAAIRHNPYLGCNRAEPNRATVTTHRWPILQKSTVFW